MKTSALIFGYNDYSSQIARNVLNKYKNISIFKLDTDEKRTDLENFSIEEFDLSDEWADYSQKYDIKKSVAFCILEDDAQNIFLTISLRSAFEDLTIIALATNKESANKLTMAGANKVIPLVETTASIITNMLDKPIVTEVLHNILYEKSDLKVAQIEVRKNTYFNGKYPSDIEWSREHGIIVLSIMHDNGKTEFIYSNRAKHHSIKNGDIFVVVGYVTDIKKFEKLVGGRVCQSV